MIDIGKGLEPDMIPGNYSHSQALSIKRLADIAEQVRDTLLVVARDPDAKDHRGFSQKDYGEVSLTLRENADNPYWTVTAHNFNVIIAALEQCAKGSI